MAFKLNYNGSGQSSVDIKRGLLKFSLKFFRKSKENLFYVNEGFSLFIHSEPVFSCNNSRVSSSNLHFFSQ